MTTKIPDPPKGLGPRGRAMWRQVVREWEPGPAERVLLVECCRTADELDVMRRQIDRDGPTVPGSKGQARPHPLLLEVQRHRASMVRLLKALDLESPGPELVTRPSVKHQKAAQARWRREAARRAQS
jgi:hypothetical protein